MSLHARAPKQLSYGKQRAPGFEDLIRQLIKGSSERQAFESGQVDAIIDPTTGRSILLPEAQEALREDQARDQSLVNLSSDWQWEKNKDLRFVSWEGTRTGHVGFEGETLIGKRLWDLPFDNMSQVEWQQHRSRLERHAPFRDLELRSSDRAGRVRYVSMSGEPIFDALGQFKGYRGTARDISKFKQPDAASQRSPGLVRATLDALAAQVCVLDPAGTVLLANKAWRAFAAGKGCIGIGVPEGGNYLALCDNPGEEERVNGIAIAAGIRQVITGERELFRHEYASNRPSGRCCFTLTATGFPGGDAARVVISHEQITGQEHTEEPSGLDIPVEMRAGISNGALIAKSAKIPNHVLASIPREEYQRLAVGLEPASLTFGDVLYEPGDLIRYVYFPGDCLISLLTQVEDRTAVEVALVGSEGMIGIPLALGVSTSNVRALVQGTGTAMRMEAERFQLEFEQSPSLQRELYRYTHLLMAQCTQTAACNRFHVIEERLARWLLMTRDRVRSDQFHLTHEFLADMLGVLRVGVTKAASALRRRKLIEYSRGNITILDRKGLIAASCGCYRIVKDLFDAAQR